MNQILRLCLFAKQIIYKHWLRETTKEKLCFENTLYQPPPAYSSISFPWLLPKLLNRFSRQVVSHWWCLSFLFLHLSIFLSIYESQFLCSIICQAVRQLSATVLLFREPRWGAWGIGVCMIWRCVLTHCIGWKPLAEVEERVEGAKEGGGERGEKLASSPHASLNRPTRLLAKSHQSWAGGGGNTWVRGRQEETDERGKRGGVG